MGGSSVIPLIFLRVGMRSFVAVALALAFATQSQAAEVLMDENVPKDDSEAYDEEASAIEFFHDLDTDKDGKVTMDEILKGMDADGTTGDELDADSQTGQIKDLLNKFFPEADTNGDGVLEVYEFPALNEQMMKAFADQETPEEL